MTFKILSKINLILLVSAFLVSGIYAEGKDTKKVKKVTGTPNITKMNINNLSTYIYNDGNSDIDENGNSGLEFPKGSGKTAVFESGLVWGAMVNNQIRVGGSAYRQGLQPGKILQDGSAEPGSNPNVRIYRVRPDYATGDLSPEANDEGASVESIRSQYEQDWMEWPAADGAPFADIDSNGTYDPAVDIPGVPGADQTIWYVANDLNPDRTTFMYGTNPMGIEMQATMWAYARQGALGNMFFRKYVIINKSQDTFNDMYVTMWSDPDVGDASDDFAGSDTTLSLGYAYNANNRDAVYGDTPPPAVGFDFFQGPIVDAPGDSAIFLGKRIYGKKNLPMTAFYYFARGDATVTDPTQGDPAGARQFYNFMQGKVGLTGNLFETPDGEPTTFVVPGDPQNRTGWIDGQLLPPGDRRIGSASGPFTMSPGDTQEVVVAEIVGGALPGTDRLSAIGLLKFYDQQAQLAYDNFFVLPTAPPAPRVTVVELDNKIVLNWGYDGPAVNATESFNDKGYTFEGYNVYQLPSPSAGKSEARLIATFDLNNGIGKIIDPDFDPESGVVLDKVAQFGNDAGIKRYIEITQDAIRNEPLVNGRRYYYAVTSYNYNPDLNAVPNNLENPLIPIMAVPHSPNPGTTSAEYGSLENIVHTGNADAIVDVEVVNPSELTGHEYEVFFNQQHYYLAQDGQWKTTNYPDSIGKALGKDVSPSVLEPMAVYSTQPGTIDLNFVLLLDSPTDAWVDGIRLTFPAGVVINGADVVAAGGGDVTPVINGNVIEYGLVNGDTTGEGIFHGDEVLTVNVNSFNPPLTVDYIIYDDGYGDGDPINAVGTANITEIGNYFVTQDHWNVRDLTTGEILIEDQTVWGGVDIYAGELGPGGSTKGQIKAVGEGVNPIVHGLKFNVTGSFAAPIEFNEVSINEGSTSVVASGSSASESATVFANYTLYGLPTSRSIDGFGVGTNDLNQLQQDYEFRYTGVLDTTVVNGKNVVTVTSGGQMATIFSTVSGGGGLANHPLNPNPGTAEPFLVRVPFEVWNIDKNEQVNLVFRDREQALDADPFYAWYPDNRNYAIIVNTPYDENKVIAMDAPNADNENATWIVVWYSTRLEQGDVVTLSYANPIQPGVDNFTFTAPAPGFSADQAKADVAKINVFPNPYYGVNSEEINKYQRFVTFSHLPNKAKIRIFNLAGQLVRIIDKESESQYERWDLANQYGLPVASGLYIAHIDMPDLGTTKILKLAIIQEQQVLDRF